MRKLKETMAGRFFILVNAVNFKKEGVEMKKSVIKRIGVLVLAVISISLFNTTSWAGQHMKRGFGNIWEDRENNAVILYEQREIVRLFEQKTNRHKTFIEENIYGYPEVYIRDLTLQTEPQSVSTFYYHKLSEPKIAENGRGVYAIWSGIALDDEDKICIYINYSPDNGESWGEEICLPIDRNVSFIIDLAYDRGNLLFLWADNTSINYSAIKSEEVESLIDGDAEAGIMVEKLFSTPHAVFRHSIDSRNTDGLFENLEESGREWIITPADLFQEWVLELRDIHGLNREGSMIGTMGELLNNNEGNLLDRLGEDINRRSQGMAPDIGNFLNGNDGLQERLGGMGLDTPENWKKHSINPEDMRNNSSSRYTRHMETADRALGRTGQSSDEPDRNNARAKSLAFRLTSLDLVENKNIKPGLIDDLVWKMFTDHTIYNLDKDEPKIKPEMEPNPYDPPKPEPKPKETEKPKEKEEMPNPEGNSGGPGGPVNPYDVVKPNTYPLNENQRRNVWPVYRKDVVPPVVDPSPEDEGSGTAPVGNIRPFDIDPSPEG